MVRVADDVVASLDQSIIVRRLTKELALESFCKSRQPKRGDQLWDSFPPM